MRKLVTILYFEQVKHGVHTGSHLEDTGEQTRLVGVDQDRDLMSRMGDGEDCLDY